MIGRGCFPRSSCCMASRRPARAGGGRRRRCAGRYRALVPDLPGHGQARAPDGELRRLRGLRPRARPGARRSRSSATRWAAGSRCTPRSRWARDRRRGSCSSARARGSRTRRARAARRRADDALADRHRDAGRSRPSRREWGAQPLFAGQPERVAAAAYADRLRNTPDGLAAALRGLGTGVMEPLWDRLEQLAIPVTLVAGERDEKFRALAERDGQAPTERAARGGRRRPRVQLSRRRRGRRYDIRVAMFRSEPARTGEAGRSGSPFTSLPPRPLPRSRRRRSPLRGARRTPRCRA